MAEVIACPKCQRQLQVPEHYLGQQVQCPECRHTFIATATSISPQPLPSAAAPAPKPAKETARPRDYDESDDAPALQRRSRYVEDDDDFDDYDNPRRNRNHYTPHRAGVILALGLIAIVGGMSFCLPVLLGPIAWVLGSWDLREIREGRMDPEGKSMTQTGQVLGIVATALMILGLPLGWFWFMMMTGAF